MCDNIWNAKEIDVEWKVCNSETNLWGWEEEKRKQRKGRDKTRLQHFTWHPWKSGVPRSRSIKIGWEASPSNVLVLQKNLFREVSWQSKFWISAFALSLSWFNLNHQLIFKIREKTLRVLELLYWLPWIFQDTTVFYGFEHLYLML